MPDAQLKISVTTEDSQLQGLQQLLNTTNVSVGRLPEILKSYKSELIAGSQAEKDYNDILLQVNQQRKSSIQVENSLTNVIRGARQERRMYMFAVNESMAAMTAIIGKEDSLTKSISQGAQAVFGIQFALQSLKGVLAEYALPIAIAVGLWTALKSIWNSSTEEAKKLNEELVKQKQELLEMEVNNRNIKAEIGHTGTTENEETRLANLKRQASDLKLVYDDYVRTGEQYTKEGLKAENDYLNLVQKVKNQEETVSNMRKKDADDESKGSEKAQKDLDKKRTALIEEQDYLRAIGDLTDREYANILATRLVQADKVKSRKEELELTKQLNALYEKNPSLNPQLITLSGRTNMGGIPKRDMNPGAINTDQFGVLKSTEDYNKESKQKEMQATQDYLIDPLKSGFQSMAYSALQGFNKMWENSSGFARTVLGQAFEGLADQLITTFEQKMLINPIMSFLFPGTSFLASGGDVVPSGGSLMFAANGLSLPYGNGQWVMTGEEGPEPLYVASNGIRVFPHNQIGEVNQMMQASRPTSGGNAEVASAISELSNKIQLASMDDWMVAQFKSNRSRNNRIYGR